MNEGGFDVNETQAKEAIKLIMDKTATTTAKKNNRPGKAWYKGFMLRNPVLHHIKNDDVQRVTCPEEKV